MQPIETAPRDGTAVWAASKGHANFPMFLYPVRARYEAGRWRAYFGEGDWRSYDPQPTHWQPIAP